MKVIVFEGPSGTAAVMVAGKSGKSIEQVAEQRAPKGYAIVDRDTLPASRAFRNAWRVRDGGVVVDVGVAKNIAHERRRGWRVATFAPLDALATVPHLAEGAEKERQKVRTRDGDLQARIDAATDESELEQITKEL